MPGTQTGERALVARLGAGDEAAFRELYEAQAPRLLRLLLRLLRGDRPLAEEVLQESFIAAFRGIAGYRSEAPLGVWLARIVVRHGLNAIREKGRREAREPRLPDEPQPQDDPIRRDLARRALGLVDALDEPKRVTMLLFAEGHTAAEIGEILGEPRGTILARLWRTRTELAERAADAGLLDDESLLRRTPL
jgi:RNA polymerase sigma-70 factor (ECF subfamily)